MIQETVTKKQQLRARKRAMVCLRPELNVAPTVKQEELEVLSLPSRAYLQADILCL